MKFLENLQAINTNFKEAIPDVYEIQVQYDNEKDFYLNETTLESKRVWIRFNVKPGEGRQADTGDQTNKRFRTPGVFIAQVLGILGDGEYYPLQVANYIATAFSGKVIGDVTYKACSIDKVGRTKRWWQVNVTCRFEFDAFSGS